MLYAGWQGRLVDNKAILSMVGWPYAGRGVAKTNSLCASSTVAVLGIVPLKHESVRTLTLGFVREVLSALGQPASRGLYT